MIIRTATDRQGREWECSLDGGLIIARRDGRAQVYHGEVGFTELPSEEVLTEILRTFDWGRGIRDADGTRWIVTADEDGIHFEEVGGRERTVHHPTEELEDLDEYSDDELVELLKEERLKMGDPIDYEERMKPRVITDEDGREWTVSIGGQPVMGVGSDRAGERASPSGTWLRFESPGQDTVTASLPPGRWIDDLTPEGLVELLVSAQET